MKLAFVIPWYGVDIPGGAETLCRTTAAKLHEAGLPVEVLTTCIKEFRSDWSQNYHKPGTEIVQNIPVRRFPVTPRNTREFDRINDRLMRRLPINQQEEAV